MQEQQIESAVSYRAEQMGWFTRKLCWTGRTGAPDRFFAKDGEIILVEFKATGKRPSEIQALEIARLRNAGVRVEVIDNIEAGFEIFC